ncbi:MAG: redox-regulated ATPase YchF [Armatimonadetes bacterium]|nr:redox-regulated ATPase YchF [Armatimonadota bacterium]
MRAGLIGYAYSGKTTLFQAVAIGHAHGDVASVPVPDPRFDRLCEDIQPKKRTHASVEIVDNAARIPEPGGARPADFAQAARRPDLLIHVVREFRSPNVPFHAEPDPERDHDAVMTELVLADLQTIENRIARLEKERESQNPGTEQYIHRTLLEHVKPLVEEGTPVRSVEMDDLEREVLQSYQLLTLKPVVVAINCSEDRIHEVSPLQEKLRSQDEPAFRICAEIEKEITRMDWDERREFYKDLGIASPATESLIRAVYDALGLISFFTVVGSEARAWPLRRGANALKAAETVHTEIARGFIRAEVVGCADFEESGSLKACYDRNLMHLERKEYVVQDGDILKIRHKT